MGRARPSCRGERKPVRLLPSRLNDKPQYVFHPHRAVRRLFKPPTGMTGEGGEAAVCVLPWGVHLQVWPGEAIGYAIRTSGAFDPCVTETMHRLIDPGDLIVDVGANVGYLTSLSVVRAGGEGRVIAFEPHPAAFGLLERNASIWERHSRLAKLELRQIALSDRTGHAQLAAGSALVTNMGLATLEHPDAVPADDLVPVELRRLDDEVGDRTIEVLKIDVEGHEPQVLRGAARLLERGLVRDVIFEDHEPYPNAATEIVESAGYKLFDLHNDLLGLCLGPPAGRGRRYGWPGPSSLATREPDRLCARLRPLGWQVQGIGPSPLAAITGSRGRHRRAA